MKRYGKKSAEERKIRLTSTSMGGSAVRTDGLQ